MKNQVDSPPDPKRSNTRRNLIRLARTIAGLALTGLLFHLFGGHDLQQALFPFLFAVGVLAAWIAGRPIGWAVSAIYMVASGWGGLVLFDLQIYHGQDLLQWSLGQTETIFLPVLLSAFLLIAGLVGWLSGELGSWFVGRIQARRRG